MEATEIEDAATEVEEIAASLNRIAEAAEKLLDGGLTMDALVLLVRHAAGVRKDDVHAVLAALPRLGLLYTTGDEEGS